jgi:hypothetical protein
MSDQLAAIIEQLQQLNQTLETFRPSPPRSSDVPGRAYLSGRWHRRDGNVYGIVQAQPKLVLGPPHADDPSGNLRPSHQR